MPRGDVAELVVPVGFPIMRLLFEACDRVVLRLVVNTEMSRLTTEKTFYTRGDGADRLLLSVVQLVPRSPSSG